MHLGVWQCTYCYSNLGVPCALDPAYVRGVKAARPKKFKKQLLLFYYYFIIIIIFAGTFMTGWDIYDCHKCPRKKIKIKKNNYFLNFYFFGSGSLGPTYVRRVKRAGDREKYCSSKHNALGQVHELLIWCLWQDKARKFMHENVEK
jgi:hypothetical protein